jgi:hypothetical protein
MIDTLGFKGIWKRVPPERVIEKLETLQQAASAEIERTLGTKDEQAKRIAEERAKIDAGVPRYGQMIFESIELSFLSDTIVMGFAESPHEALGLAPLSMDVIEFACRYTSIVLALAAGSDPVLTYRGCIAYGPFELHSRFMVGLAVDEAAESLDLAQGGFVWLLPSAKRECTLTLAAGIQRGDIYRYRVPYIVPLKGGDTYETLAVSPLMLAKTEDDCRTTRKQILDTFAGNLDVEIKRQNTERFLDHCMSRWLPPVS